MNPRFGIQTTSVAVIDHTNDLAPTSSLEVELTFINRRFVGKVSFGFGD
jgi:hypothetical protein